ncbi:MAG: Trm112 family protein [Planctomycetaceae bacterium]
MQSPTFKADLLERMLICPKSKAALVQHGEALISTDPATRMKYLIRDGIPVMLVDEAVELSELEWQQIMQQHGRDTQGQPNH